MGQHKVDDGQARLQPSGSVNTQGQTYPQNLSAADSRVKDQKDNLMLHSSSQKQQLSANSFEGGNKQQSGGLSVSQTSSVSNFMNKDSLVYTGQEERQRIMSGTASPMNPQFFQTGPLQNPQDVLANMLIANGNGQQQPAPLTVGGTRTDLSAFKTPNSKVVSEDMRELMRTDMHPLQSPLQSCGSAQLFKGSQQLSQADYSSARRDPSPHMSIPAVGVQRNDIQVAKQDQLATHQHQSGQSKPYGLVSHQIFQNQSQLPLNPSQMPENKTKPDIPKPKTSSNRLPVESSQRSQDGPLHSLHASQQSTNTLISQASPPQPRPKPVQSKMLQQSKHDQAPMNQVQAHNLGLYTPGQQPPGLSNGGALQGNPPTAGAPLNEASRMPNPTLYNLPQTGTSTSHPISSNRITPSPDYQQANSYSLQQSFGPQPVNVAPHHQQEAEMSFNLSQHSGHEVHTSERIDVAPNNDLASLQKGSYGQATHQYSNTVTSHPRNQTQVAPSQIMQASSAPIRQPSQDPHIPNQMVTIHSNREYSSRENSPAPIMASRQQPTQPQAPIVQQPHDRHLPGQQTHLQTNPAPISSPVTVARNPSHPPHRVSNGSRPEATPSQNRQAPPKLSSQELVIDYGNDTRQAEPAIQQIIQRVNNEPGLTVTNVKVVQGQMQTQHYHHEHNVEGRQRQPTDTLTVNQSHQYQQIPGPALPSQPGAAVGPAIVKIPSAVLAPHQIHLLQNHDPFVYAANQVPGALVQPTPHYPRAQPHHQAPAHFFPDSFPVDGQHKVHMIGDQQIIENKPYIFDEMGKKIYVDPNNLSAFSKIARQAPPGVLNQPALNIKAGPIPDFQQAHVPMFMHGRQETHALPPGFPQTGPLHIQAPGVQMQQGVYIPPEPVVHQLAGPGNKRTRHDDRRRSNHHQTPYSNKYENHPTLISQECGQIAADLEYKTSRHRHRSRSRNHPKGSGYESQPAGYQPRSQPYEAKPVGTRHGARAPGITRHEPTRDIATQNRPQSRSRRQSSKDYEEDSDDDGQSDSYSEYSQSRSRKHSRSVSSRHRSRKGSSRYLPTTSPQQYQAYQSSSRAGEGLKQRAKDVQIGEYGSYKSNDAQLIRPIGSNSSLRQDYARVGPSNPASSISQRPGPASGLGLGFPEAYSPESNYSSQQMNRSWGATKLENPLQARGQEVDEVVNRIMQRTFN